MSARPPFPQAMGVYAVPEIPDPLADAASQAAGALGEATARRLEDLGLPLPRRVDVQIYAGDEVPGMPGMGGQTRLLPRRRVLIELALDPARPWDSVKLVMLCHEFGHVVAGAFPDLAPEDLGYLVEEYLAEREAWGLLWQVAADPREDLIASLARAHYEGGLEAAAGAWARARRDLAVAMSAGDGVTAVRRFHDALYVVLRLLAYSVADAQRAGCPAVLPRALPGYAASAITPLLEPLEGLGAMGDPLSATDFPGLRAAFAGLPALAGGAGERLTLAAVRRMSEARQVALLTSARAARGAPPYEG